MSKRQLQLALDVDDVAVGIKAAMLAEPAVDIIEDGTVLCLAQGLGTVKILRSVFTDKTILADVRIARAGGKFSAMCFQAGADRVSVVGESGFNVVKSACSMASKYGCGVEVELFPGWSDKDIKDFVDAGVQVLIVHRDRCTPDENQQVLEELNQLHSLVEGSGVKVALAGGLNLQSLRIFKNSFFDIAVVGSAIVNAPEPLAEARKIRELLFEMDK